MTVLLVSEDAANTQVFMRKNPHPDKMLASLIPYAPVSPSKFAEWVQTLG